MSTDEKLLLEMHREVGGCVQGGAFIRHRGHTAIQTWSDPLEVSGQIRDGSHS